MIELLQRFVIDTPEHQEEPVWTWSIAGNGSRESIIDAVTSALEVDGDGAPLTEGALEQFQGARKATLDLLNAMIPGVHARVSVSGNDTTYKPTVAWEPAR